MERIVPNGKDSIKLHPRYNGKVNYKEVRRGNVMNSGCDTHKWRLILVIDVMFLLELCQLLLSSRQLCLSGRCILFRRHVIQHHDISFLQVEPVQVVKSIFGLGARQRPPRRKGRSKRGKSTVTHVHHVVKHHKRCALCFLLIPYANLTDAPIASEQVVKVFAGDLVVQVLHEEDPVCARRQF